MLFKGCTNYKLVLGDEDKNIFSQLVSVNNLRCYLETWHSFRVAENAHAVCEGPQQSFLLVLLLGKARKGVFLFLFF